MDIANISESVKSAIRIAQSLAREYHNPVFTGAHLLYGLMHHDIGLQGIVKDPGYLEDWAIVRVEEQRKSMDAVAEVTGSAEIPRILEAADDIRTRMGQDEVTPISVLAALCRPGIAFGPEQLKSFPLKEEDLLENESIRQVVAPDQPVATGALYKYGVDRIALAREGKTDPIIGRDREVRMMMEILGRRTKPNVIITGDAGVGKTALVDGFALDILAGNVPENLRYTQLFELDLGALAAGASYKGEMEDRLKSILREVKQFDRVILFIDEIHTLLDNKGVANLLKPELARGAITVIGATTLEEYRKIIEPEQAFSRRFEVLMVNEPTEAVAVKMLERLREQYEMHHQLQINPVAIPECVRLARRYMKDRRLPDSAFDLMDRTLAAIRLMNDTSEKTVDELSTALDMAQTEADLKWVEMQLQEKVSPVLLGKIQEAALSEKIAALQAFATQKITEVGAEEVAAVVSYKTGIPIGKIRTDEKERLLQIEQFLQKRVVGQDYALKAVSDAILESRSGLNKKGQPIGSFFLLGPTGTGKTELAKSIAEFLFNDEKAMIRFDMSEFKEEHSAALLYGAPPGYVGYEEGGLLVNKIRQQPYSVLLFDEIEKAHPSVFDIFLQILDEGQLHDRLGKRGDFSNSLILFTSNIGSDQIYKSDTPPASAQLMETMSAWFRPEFLARLSEIVPFAPISEQNVVRIFEIQLRSLVDALQVQGIGFDIQEDATRMLALGGFNPKYGARQLSSVIRNELRRPISRYIVSGELKKGQVVGVRKHAAEEKLEWTIH
jgi:ATP-dependent Clp protease ATP-binding subunit ClpA